MKFIIIFLILFTFVFVNSFPNVLGEPILFDDNLILEEFSREAGWGYTAMTFVEDDILVLEKDGFVKSKMKERRRMYEITKKGEEALKRAKGFYEKILKKLK